MRLEKEADNPGLAIHE